MSIYRPHTPSELESTRSFPSLKRNHITARTSNQDQAFPPIIGKYRILNFMSEGSISWMYKAMDTSTSQWVALKVFKPVFEEMPGMTERFKREAIMGKVLDHPNIISVYDLDYRDGYRFIAMELLTGETLNDRVKRHKYLDVETSVALGLRLCSALDHLFQAGIVHQNLKLSNLMFSRNGVMKITDLSMARPVNVAAQISGNFPTLMSTTKHLGTPHYLSPERILDHDAASIHTDMYALGVCLYKMLTGSYPFEGKSVKDIMISHLMNEPIPASKRRPSIGTQLNRVIYRLLQKEPQERFQDYDELKTELQKCLRCESTAKIDFE